MPQQKRKTFKLSKLFYTIILDWYEISKIRHAYCSLHLGSISVAGV